MWLRIYLNPSNCECKWHKSSDTCEYLDYENRNCRKKLVDQIVEECTETVKEKKIACILYIVLFSILFTLKLGLILFFRVGIWKKMFHMLSLILVLKQKFIKFSYIELMNGRSQANWD